MSDSRESGKALGKRWGIVMREYVRASVGVVSREMEGEREVVSREVVSREGKDGIFEG